MSDGVKFQPFCEFWRRCWCPACNVANWLYDSHSERAYPDAPQACECHACEHKFWTGSENDFKDEFWTCFDEDKMTIEQIFEEFVHFEKGRTVPD